MRIAALRLHQERKPVAINPVFCFSRGIGTASATGLPVFSLVDDMIGRRIFSANSKIKGVHSPSCSCVECLVVPGTC